MHCIDVETDGLEPHRGHRPFLVGCESEAGRVDVVDFTRDGGRREEERVRRVVEDPREPKVAHNAKFELRMLRALGWRPAGPWLDTMQMAVLRNEYEPSIRLKALAERHLETDAHGEADAIDAWIKARSRELKRLGLPAPTFKDFYLESPGNAALMRRYLERDLDDTLKLAWAYLPVMRRDYEDPFRAEMDLVPVVADMEDVGIRVDLDYVDRFLDEVVAEAAALRSAMDAMVGRADWNPGSWQQLKRILAARGRPVPNTKSETLAGLDDEFAGALLRWRALDKIRSTFLEPLMEMHVGGVVHASFWQNGEDEGIKTGRFSCTRPNLQNQPSRTPLGKRVRMAFVPRPGHVLIPLDYQQIEPRLLAHYVGDPELIDWMRRLDPYVAVAKMMDHPGAGPGMPENERFTYKTTTLALIYGLGKAKMARKLGVPVQEAVAKKAGFFRAIPGARELMYRLGSELRRSGYVSDVYGRRYRVPPDLSYKAINAVIQGTAAGVIKRAMVRVARALQSLGRGRILVQVHDELLVEAPVRHAREVAEATAAAMRDERFALAMEAEIKYCPRGWGEKTKEPPRAAVRRRKT